MGIHVEVFKKKINRALYYTFLRSLATDLTRFLCIKGYIASDQLRVSIIALREEDKKFDEETKVSPSATMNTIKEMSARFNHSRVSFQIAGMLKLSNPKNGEPYPVNFEIFLPGHNYQNVDYGDMLFDIGGTSEEFSGGTDYGFDSFFGPGDFNQANRIFLQQVLKFLRQRNYPVKQIERINVGEQAMPFTRLQSCIYVYRPSYEIFQNDLIRCYALIRKDTQDDSLLLSPERQTDLQARWDKDKDFLPIFEHPYLQHQLLMLNEENTKITDFFNTIAVAKKGSFILHHKAKNSYRPLYPVLEAFHTKLTEALTKMLPFKPEDFWKHLSKNW